MNLSLVQVHVGEDIVREDEFLDREESIVEFKPRNQCDIQEDRIGNRWNDCRWRC